MFSFFSTSFLIGTISWILILLGQPKLLFTNFYPTLIIGLCLFILNFILFSPKGKQIKQYQNYKNAQSKTKDIMALLFCVISIIIIYTAMLEVRSNFVLD
jgi:hypothetical protein